MNEFSCLITVKFYGKGQNVVHDVWPMYKTSLTCSLCQKPTTALGYISAHMSRIHDLDWSFTEEKQLTTCSHDATIKFWDISSPREPFSTIKVAAQPLWRARNYVSRQWKCVCMCVCMLPVFKDLEELTYST